MFGRCSHWFKEISIRGYVAHVEDNLWNIDRCRKEAIMAKKIGGYIPGIVRNGIHF